MKFLGTSAAMRHTRELAMKLSQSMENFAEKNDEAAEAQAIAAKHASAFFCRLDTTLAGAPKGPAPGTVPGTAARSRSRGRGRVPMPPAATAAAGAAAPPARAGHLPPGLTGTAGQMLTGLAGPAPSAGPAGPPVLQQVQGCSSTELSEVLCRVAKNRPRRPPL